MLSPPLLSGPVVFDAPAVELLQGGAVVGFSLLDVGDDLFPRDTGKLEPVEKREEPITPPRIQPLLSPLDLVLSDTRADLLFN